MYTVRRWLFPSELSLHLDHFRSFSSGTSQPWFMTTPRGKSYYILPSISPEETIETMRKTIYHKGWQMSQLNITQPLGIFHLQQIFVSVMWTKSPKRDIDQPLYQRHPFFPEAIHGHPLSPRPHLGSLPAPRFLRLRRGLGIRARAGSGGQDVLGHRGLPMAIPKWMIYTRKREKNHDQLTMINYRWILGVHLETRKPRCVLIMNKMDHF